MSKMDTKSMHASTYDVKRNNEDFTFIIFVDKAATNYMEIENL